MGFFDRPNEAITEEVEKATNEKNTQDDWAAIMNICDRAKASSEEARNYLRAIIKRLYHPDPHVGVQAVTLLDACVKNSGKTFQTEVASREFEDNFNKLMTKGHRTVAKNLRLSLKKWAENEFKSDPQLNLIPTLYSKLKDAGFDFSATEAPVKKAPVCKDPNVVESQEEEEQILKAIELSLKETRKDSVGSPKSTVVTTSSATTGSLYPSASLISTAAAPAKEPRKVRALYDFEAAEDNELTFTAGEILLVLDDSDPNWWKGSNHRGEGLFPSNFVTADLSVEPEKFLFERAKKMVQFKEAVDVKTVEQENDQEVEINEEKIDRLLHLLHEADPTNPETDTEEMLKLERECNAMQPLIDAELESVDRRHAQLTQLSSNLVDALGLYHLLMREPQFPPVHKMPYGYSSSTLPPHTSMSYNGNVPATSMPMGPPGMPVVTSMSQGQERQMFIPPGSMHGMPPQSMPQQYQPMSGVMTLGRMSLGNVPPNQMQMNPNMQQPSQQYIAATMPPNDRRNDANIAVPPYASLPTFTAGPISFPPNFQPSNINSQTQVQNGPPPQAGHFISTSSSHIM